MEFPFSEENKIIGEEYDKLCHRFGDSSQAVGWFSEYTQKARFLIATFLDDLTGSEVLDIGCGQAAFYGYLLENNLKVKYHGIDLSKEMISLAKKNYPKDKFIIGDFLDPDFENQYDYLISSGAFNQKTKDQDHYIKCIITKMFNLCRKGISFNLLSRYTPEKLQYPDTFFYYDPITILKFCFSLTPYAVLYQHYLPNDFTVQMFRV